MEPLSRASKSCDPIRLMIMVTSHVSVGLMRGQLKFLRLSGFDVSVVSSRGPTLDAAAEQEGIETYEVPMAREIRGVSDLIALYRLWMLIRRIRPTVTSVGTPKAGLLGGLASYLCRVPCRIYTLRGLRCETSTGLKRWLLVQAERLACACAHEVICVSDSLRRKALALGIVRAEKAVVLGFGSSNGVDLERFSPTAERLHHASDLRTQMGIPAGAPVIGFVGRFTRDKGICELMEAFTRLRCEHSDLRLLLVGDFDGSDKIPEPMRLSMAKTPGVISTGVVDDTSAYYQLMDFVVLPTHREGFPNVVLEAHASAKAVITTRATGAEDSVVDNVTGILVPVADIDSLTAALSRLVQNRQEAREMGLAARDRVQRNFRQEVVWKAIKQQILQMLHRKGLPSPDAMNNSYQAIASIGTPRF